MSKEDGAVTWQQSENGYKQDAESEVKILRKKYPLYHILGEAVPILKYAVRGKPSADTVPEVKGYKLDLVLEMNTKAVEALLNRKGRFILATNDLDATGYSDERMLSEYKSQQNVEGGFRFLKDPWFMVDSVFLKSPSRIESLMIVGLPNQLDKEVQNPTIRWIFQIMEGIGMVRFYELGGNRPIRKPVTNMTDLRRRIIHLFGATAFQMYGLNPKMSPGGVGMLDMRPLLREFCFATLLTYKTRSVHSE